MMDETTWTEMRHSLVAGFTRAMAVPGADVRRLRRRRGRERAFLTLGFEGARCAAAKGHGTRQKRR
jgi:hypothetical protein